MASFVVNAFLAFLEQFDGLFAFFVQVIQINSEILVVVQQMQSFFVIVINQQQMLVGVRQDVCKEKTISNQLGSFEQKKSRIYLK